MSSKDDVPVPIVAAVLTALAIAGVAVGTADLGPRQTDFGSTVAAHDGEQATLAKQSRGDRPLRTNPASATEPAFNPGPLCKARYPLDHDMRDVCIKSEQEARFEASNMRIDDDVGALCTKRYPDDWSMYVVCAKEQMEAKLPISDKADKPDFDIAAKCQKEWPGDYRMEEYCIEKQEEARSEAGGNWIDHEIAVHCTGEYPGDWSMFMYCVNQHSESKNRLR